jgi:hypothetical protein
MTNVLKRNWLGIAALAAVALYLLDTTQVLQLPSRLTRLWTFSLGPLGIVGVLSISSRLRSTSNRLTVLVANAFGVTAFALWEAVTAIQSGSRLLFREHFIPRAPDEATKEVLRHVYQAANAVQATMDVAFDVFYCLAILVLGLLMHGSQQFGKVVALVGMASAAGLLAFNLWTFPVPPADAGLVDLGPVTGAWWAIVIVILLRTERGALPRSVHGRGGTDA